MEHRNKDILKGMFLYALAGPPVGLLCVVGVVAVSVGKQASWDGIWLVLFASYLAGMIPASMTGMVAGLLRRRYRRMQGVAISALAGAVFSAALSVVVIVAAALLQGSNLHQHIVTTTAIIATIGGVAGAVCGIIFFNRRMSPPQG